MQVIKRSLYHRQIVPKCKVMRLTRYYVWSGFVFTVLWKTLRYVASCKICGAPAQVLCTTVSGIWACQVFELSKVLSFFFSDSCSNKQSVQIASDVFIYFWIAINIGSSWLRHKTVFPCIKYLATSKCMIRIQIMFAKSDAANYTFLSWNEKVEIVISLYLCKINFFLGRVEKNCKETAFRKLY